MTRRLHTSGKIHKTAIIGKDVQIGENVSIGAYSLVENGVSIGDNVEIRSHVVLRSGTAIQGNVLIDSFSVIGGEPQGISDFDRSKKTGVVIGDGTIIREHVTIHRAFVEKTNTVINRNCLLMTGSHVAHDSFIGHNVTLITGVKVGGYASVGDYCYIGGGSLIHQHIRVGEAVFLSGYSATAMDLPPYTLCAGLTRVIWLNFYGLNKLHVRREVIAELKKCFSEMYGGSGPFPERAKALIASGKFHSREAMKFLEFFTAFTRRGFAPLRRQMHKKNQSSGIASDFGSSM